MMDTADESDWADETGCVDGPKHDYVYCGGGVWRCRREGCNAEIWEDRPKRLVGMPDLAPPDIDPVAHIDGDPQVGAPGG